MNDDLNTIIAEIEESSNEDESTASGEGTDDTSSDDDLDVEDLFTTSSDTPKKKTASEIAEQQKEAWARNIASGKKTIEDLENTPSAKWMVQEVKKRLGISPSSDDLEAKIKAYDSSKQFKQDIETLKGLPIDVKKEIIRISKEYLEVGASSEKALRKALEKSKDIVEEKEKERKIRVESGKLPEGKSSSGTPVYTASQLLKMSDSEYKSFREKEKRGEIIVKLK